MSKPMLVTLPFVMLLLDFWPLNRVTGYRLQVESSATANQPSTFNLQLSTVLEKWPFFLLTAISCLVTFFAQRNGEAVVSLANVSLLHRLENAPVALARYLLKIIWPANLAVIYPMPERIPLLAITAAIVVLLLISVAAWLLRKKNPYLIVGWLWFLGTLVPVIGLVQVGGAALA